MSQTIRRAILYLTLALSVVAVLSLWPAPSDDGDAPIADSSYAAGGDLRRHHGAYLAGGERYVHHATGQADGNRYGDNRWRQDDGNGDTGGRRDTHALALDGNSNGKPPLQWQSPLPHKRKLLVDINTADTLTLQLLHGIGSYRALKIVQYRQRLGGFVSMDQLLEVYSITPDLLADLRPHLTISSDSLRPIPINSIDIKRLARHPYIDYYQARDIIAYRQRGHRFHSLDDLRLVASMDDTTLRRLAPYIRFD